MPEATPRSRSDTADQILDQAELLIQTRGYSAFSYQDVADALGVRKASIHYHFASKSDLGTAVVERYAARFSEAMTLLAEGAATKLTGSEILDQYTVPFTEFAGTPDRVCLCGALAGEIMALPPEMRASVKHFFAAHIATLAGILEKASERGEFRLSAPADQVARTIFGALQGALLIKRTTGDTDYLFDVIAVLRGQLLPSDSG